MTSTTGTAQHPEVPEIADLTEGLLTPSRAAEVRSHLAECEPCAAVRDSLEEIQGLLSDLPDPEPMPEDIAARIDAALAAEAREADVSRETSSTETGEAPSETPRPGSSPDRPAGRPRGATGPGRRPRRRLRAALLGTAYAALIGMSVLFLQNLSSSSNDAASKADRSISADASEAPSFSQETLETTVQDLLAGGAGAKQFDMQKRSPSVDEQSAPEAELPETAASKNPLSAPAIAVPPCVQQATGRTTPALALERGTYQGANAFLVVLPHASDSSRVQAYVVAASCVDTAPTSTGQLLHTQAYNHP